LLRLQAELEAAVGVRLKYFMDPLVKGSDESKPSHIGNAARGGIREAAFWLARLPVLMGMPIAKPTAAVLESTILYRQGHTCL
jgi:hypothetical protein